MIYFNFFFQLFQVSKKEHRILNLLISVKFKHEANKWGWSWLTYLTKKTAETCWENVFFSKPQVLYLRGKWTSFEKKILNFGDAIFKNNYKFSHYIFCVKTAFLLILPRVLYSTAENCRKLFVFSSMILS